MMHFGPKFNTCPDRRRGDTKSNALAIEKFQHMQRQHPGSYCARCAGEIPRTDSDRYADLRKLVEAYQSAKSYAEAETLLVELRNWSHR